MPTNITKIWGEEEVICNTPLYATKYLYLNPGFVCSEHRHPVKDETFHVVAGDGVISVQGKIQRVKVGDTVHVPVGQYHYFATKTGMTLLEVSTEHSDADVERLSQSHALDPERDHVIIRWLDKEA